MIRIKLNKKLNIIPQYGIFKIKPVKTQKSQKYSWKMLILLKNVLLKTEVK